MYLIEIIYNIKIDSRQAAKDSKRRKFTTKHIQASLTYEKKEFWNKVFLSNFRVFCVFRGLKNLILGFLVMRNKIKGEFQR
jgi:hypothetical protein